MFFNKTEKDAESLDRMEELTTKYKFISFYGMLYYNTNNYLFILFILCYFLSFY
jgi:hypothetical protein